MTRWITGIILAFLVALLILKGSPRVCQLIVLIMSGLAAREYFLLAVPDFRSRYFGMILTLIGVSVVLFRFEATHLMAFIYMLVLCSFLLKISLQSLSVNDSWNQVCYFGFGVLYLTLGFGSLGRLMIVPNFHFWIFLAFASTFLGDTFAYLAGRRFGKKKLAPLLSPGKTEAGFWGSLVGGALGALAVRSIFWPDLPLGKAVFFGVVIAVLGVVGDLSESLIKRAFNVKDSGTLIPGHGGILDRVDALLFTAPFVYLIATWTK